MNGCRAQWCIEYATRGIVHLNVERSYDEVSSMEQIINVHIERRPEGVYLATTDEVPGHVAQGRTVTETPDIARDVARKRLETRTERQGPPMLKESGDSFDYALVVGGC